MCIKIHIFNVFAKNKFELKWLEVVSFSKYFNTIIKPK